MHAKKRNAKKVQQQLVVMIAAARIRKLKMFEACDFQPGDITSSHNLVAFLFVFFFSPPDSTLHTSTGNASGATNKSSKRANSSTIRGIIAVVAANQNYSQAGAAIIRHN